MIQDITSDEETVHKCSQMKQIAKLKRNTMKINYRKVITLVVMTLFSVVISIRAQEAVQSQQKAAIAEQEKREQESTLIHEGDIAPDFEVVMLDGQKIKLSDLKGKVVLLNFWATWCPPCMMEFNEIPDQIIKRFKGKNFVFLAISRGEKREDVKTKMIALKSKGIDFPVGLDPTKIIYTQYAKEFIPRNFVIDRNGKVSYTTVGYSKEGLETLVNKIEELLK